MPARASDHLVSTAAGRLRAGLAMPGLARAVAAYFAGPEFAGLTFTSLGRNPPGQITPDDLLAVALLDITWRPRVVRVLLDTRRAEFAALIAAIAPDLDLWDASDQDLGPADAAWDALTAVDGIGTASTAKLLARKRPRLCPISDSIMIRAVDVPGRTWDTLRCLLRDPAARADVEALRPPAAAAVSLLRILDVALWVTHSSTAAARQVRYEAGMPAARQARSQAATPGRTTTDLRPRLRQHLADQYPGPPGRPPATPWRPGHREAQPGADQHQ